MVLSSLLCRLYLKCSIIYLLFSLKADKGGCEYPMMPTLDPASLGTLNLRPRPKTVFPVLLVHHLRLDLTVSRSHKSKKQTKTYIADIYENFLWEVSAKIISVNSLSAYCCFYFSSL